MKWKQPIPSAVKSFTQRQPQNKIQNEWMMIKASWYSETRNNGLYGIHFVLFFYLSLSGTHTQCCWKRTVQNADVTLVVWNVRKRSLRGNLNILQSGALT
jgi:hypothetical protein